MSQVFFYLLILLLPSQLGRHFWPKEAFVWGIRMDYLAPTVYLTDIVIFLMIVSWLIEKIQRYQDTKIWRVIKQLVIKKLRIKNILPYFLVLVLLLINCLLAKNQIAAFYKLFKILEFGALVFCLKELVIARKPAYWQAGGAARQSRTELLRSLRPLAMTEKMIDLSTVFSFLAINIFYSSIIAIWQFLKQGSIGGLFWSLGERTFTAQTLGISQINFAGRLLLRPYATFPHPNVLGGFLALTLPIIFYFVIARSPVFGGARNNILRLFYLLTFLLGLIALFLTFSRTAILAFLVSLIFMTFRSFKMTSSPAIFAKRAGSSVFSYPPKAGAKIKKTIIAKKILATLFVLILASSFYLLASHIKSPESLAYRAELNKIALKMIAGQPIFGVGLNNFIVRLPDYGPPGMTVRFLQPVHNIYLLITAELGIPGLVMFLWLLYHVVCSKQQVAWRKNTSSPHTTYYLLLATILFLGLFDHYFLTLQQGQILFALVLGLNLKY